jgi:hypothetical protein
MDSYTALLTTPGPSSMYKLPVFIKSSVADPDRFGPDPDPTFENRPDPDPDSDPIKTRSGSGFI